MSISISAANVRLKRAYEPADAADGASGLVDRLWPRSSKTENVAARKGSALNKLSD